MKRILLFALLLCSISAFGQGVRYDNSRSTTASVAQIGKTVFIAVPNGTVNVCNSPATGSSSTQGCTNKAQTYTDATLGTPCSTSAQIVPAGTTSCVATADEQGNWGVWVAQGQQLTYTVCSNGTCYGPHPITLAVTSLSSPGPIGETTQSTRNFTTSADTNFVTSHAGVFTTQEEDYLTSSVNSCSPQTEIQAGQGASFWNVSAITGCVKYPVGGTNTQVTGIAGLATGPGAWPPHGALVGVYGQGRCTANNCAGWGGNLIYEDDGKRTAGMSGHGLEIDVGQQSPSTAYSNLFGIATSLGGNGTGLVRNSYAYEAGVQSTPHNLQWNWAFYSQQGASAQGVFLGPTATSGTANAQGITFQGLASGRQKTVTLGGSSAGDLNVSPTSGRFLNVFGNFGLIEQSSGTVSPGSSVLYADSTAHNLQASYSGDAFKPVARVIASGTAAMTTAAIKEGDCGTTVSVSATGVLATDSITWSFNAAPAGSNAGIVSWSASDNVNFAYCPNRDETPAAATINWSVVR